MTKFKVICEEDIHVNLFQVPKMTLETGGIYDLDMGLVDAIQDMTTVKLFEKVVDDKDLSELTNAELKSMLDEKGIEYNDKDTKAVLISHFDGVK